MNPEVKTKWLTALRSGEYKQGTKLLKSPDGSYCCLGVLTDLAVKEGKISENDAYYSNFFLPTKVADWAGLGNSDPDIPCSAVKDLNKDLIPIRDKVYLSVINDIGRSFKEIADLIENHL